MAVFNTVEEAKDFFAKDHFAGDNGIRLLAMEEDSVLCSMELSEHTENAAGGVMGGAIFTLADFAFAVASNNIHRLTVALQSSVNFFSQPRGDKLFARAACEKDGRTTCVYRVDVTDAEGRAVAQVITTGYKLP